MAATFSSLTFCKFDTQRRLNTLKQQNSSNQFPRLSSLTCCASLHFIFISPSFFFCFFFLRRDVLAPDPTLYHFGFSLFIFQARKSSRASKPLPSFTQRRRRVGQGTRVNAMLVLWEGLDSGRSAGVTVAVLSCDRLSPGGSGVNIIRHAESPALVF